MTRKYVNCAEFPGSSCTLRISGEEEEVVRMASLHAVDAHGHQDTPELREQIRGLLKDEAPATV